MTIGFPATPPEPASRSRARGLTAILLIAVVVVGAALAWWQTRADQQTADAAAVSRAAAVTDTAARAPDGVRIRLRVLNTSGVSGLARRATGHLREYGFDVVDFGSGRTAPGAGTKIIVHTGHADWAARVGKALGVGIVSADPDTSRYVDLTILIGSDWRPPTESFRP